MASQTQGIQQLLQAEKRAAEKVGEARRRKTHRLKQAKEEAQGELEQYRRRREKEFQHQREKVLGSQGDGTERMEQETEERIKNICLSYKENHEAVISRVIDIVCSVTPTVHINFVPPNEKVVEMADETSVL
uniref:V-type proton ATPase subunit G 2-like n=1 Tax=Myxine glutinosa TaxID=7769 RepID=UPI0035900548